MDDVEHEIMCDQAVEADQWAEDDWAEMCECELDYRCPMHQGLPTPEDLIATEWSRNNP